MKLSGQQIQQIQSALLSAFPSKELLSMMVRMELDVDLDSIAGGNDMRAVIFNLLSWAERWNRVHDLIQAAYRQNSGNVELQRLVDSARSWSAQEFTTPRATEVHTTSVAEPVDVDIFLSYSRRDISIMHRVYEELRDAGFFVWIDEGLEPGTPSWKSTVEEMVKQAGCLVALLTPNSKTSSWVNNEIGYARILGRQVIPVVVAGDETTSIPMELVSTQWIDARRDLPNAIRQELIPSVRKWLQIYRTSTFIRERLKNASRDWDSLDRDPSLLFRGTLLDRATAWEKHGRVNLSELERDFLRASRAAAESEQNEQVSKSQQLQEAREQVETLQLGLSRELDRRTASETHLSELNAELEALKTKNEGREDRLEQIERIHSKETRSFRNRQNIFLAVIVVSVAIMLFMYAMIHTKNSEISLWQRESWTRESKYQALAATATASAGLARLFIDGLSTTGTWTNSIDGAIYGPVSEGEFEMGSSEAEIDGVLSACLEERSDCDRAWFENELGQNTPLWLDGFWIKVTEVTNSEYKRCLDAGGCSEEPGNEYWMQSEYANYPVVNVGWSQAEQYATWVGGRLPTEAEWEKACRGTEGAIYSWGNGPPNILLLNYDQNVGSREAVASYPPGAYGLYDMLGNVWEWTSTDLLQYPYDPADGRDVHKSWNQPVVRGGAYYSRGYQTRCAYRSWSGEPEGHGSTGFRVVIPMP